MRTELKYVVECKPKMQKYFEAIAAFNVERVAYGYMTDCIFANPAFEYRVIEDK